MVQFIGEEGADEGGPRREFLTLLVSAIVSTAGVLEGSVGRKNFTLNPMLLDENVYFQAGRMVAVAIQQNGPGMACLSPGVYYTIAQTPSMCKLSPDDIPYPDIKQKIVKVIIIIVNV